MLRLIGFTSLARLQKLLDPHPPLPQPYLSMLRDRVRKAALVTQACGTASWPKRKGLELHSGMFILPWLALLSDLSLNG